MSWGDFNGEVVHHQYDYHMPQNRVSDILTHVTLNTINNVVESLIIKLVCSIPFTLKLLAIYLAYKFQCSKWCLDGSHVQWPWRVHGHCSWMLRAWPLCKPIVFQAFFALSWVFLISIPLWYLTFRMITFQFFKASRVWNWTTPFMTFRVAHWNTQDNSLAFQYAKGSYYWAY